MRNIKDNLSCGFHLLYTSAMLYSRMTLWALWVACALLAACGGRPWNHPHARLDASLITYHASFNEPPKTLDPARAYSSNEIALIAQIYEPPLQYDPLKRPYQLIPLTAAQMPSVTFLDKNKQPLPANAPASHVAYSRYDIYIRPNIYYAPHPAFSSAQQDKQQTVTGASPQTSTTPRELVAADYAYQIKRLADPHLNTPIFSVMTRYLVGLKHLSEQLARARRAQPRWLDLRTQAFEGVTVKSRYHYQILIKGRYPQFMYWLAMSFFSPMPWEVDQFYSQPERGAQNLTLDTMAVGTGAYQLTQNNPNREMVLSRNPNYHAKPLPYIDRYIFSLEKESIPRWNKFLQGYYDESSIGSEQFDQAIRIDAHGNPKLTPFLKQKHVTLTTSTPPNIFYIGFNMLDPIVGGYSERARHLRRAIAMAVDFQEFIAIFLNGRGEVAKGPIPPGVFGYRRLKRPSPSLAEAKKVLALAGYPGGRDPKTGKPLVLNYDVPMSAGPDSNARFDWMRKQFDKIGIHLHVRSTQYNRFQQKMSDGNAQLFLWGWMADYPDPENFLFLLYGPNGKVKQGGENAANYNNPKFNALFEKMQAMKDGPQRQAIIDKMVAIAQHDSPWIWGFHSKDFILSHEWVSAPPPNGVANNVLQYKRLNPTLRDQKIAQWNRPILWPLGVLGILVAALVLPILLTYLWKLHRPTL